MKAFHILAEITAGVLLGGAAAPAQTVVVGTSDPNIDIAAVQSAVDRGGSIVLRGHFSFENPPTAHAALDGLIAVILVSKPVTISGTWDERGELTTIHGGEIPFAVEAPGANVRIEKLRFARPKRSAIFAVAAGGLAIESCAIERVEALPPLWNPVGTTLASGIHISSLLGLPAPDRPGKPENIHGKVSIADNEVSVSETADHGVGIMVVSAGDATNPVEVDISRNTVRNANQEGINVKYIGGRVRIDGNTVISNTVYSGPARGPIAAIHSLGSGSYRITRNRIEIADPNGAGIRARGYSDSQVIIERVITGNDVTISAAEDSTFGAWSAGIDVRGFGRDNVVRGNRIRGRARIGLSLARDGSIPAGYTLDQNDQSGFISLSKDGGRRQEK